MFTRKATDSLLRRESTGLTKEFTSTSARGTCPAAFELRRCPLRRLTVALTWRNAFSHESASEAMQSAFVFARYASIYCLLCKSKDQSENFMSTCARIRQPDTSTCQLRLEARP